MTDPRDARIEELEQLCGEKQRAATELEVRLQACKAELHGTIVAGKQMERERDEARAEVQRLQGLTRMSVLRDAVEENDRFRDEQDRTAAYITQLQAENARLREALEQIATSKGDALFLALVASETLARLASTREGRDG